MAARGESGVTQTVVIAIALTVRPKKNPCTTRLVRSQNGQTAPKGGQE